LSRLLGPGDPPPVDVVNERGQAHLLLTCDHAGLAVPRALGDLGLDAEKRARHIGWDIGAAAVTRRLASALDAPAVLSAYSRLVIDCNRRPGQPGSIAAESDGVVVPANQKVDEATAERRRIEIFEPYHQAIERIILDRLGALRPLAILSVHSFTPEMNNFTRPWHVGILWDEDPRLAVPLMRALSADPALVVGDNEPYSARGRRGYGLHIHAADRGLAGALIEIRQDLIADEAGQAAWAARLAAILPGLLARAGL